MTMHERYVHATCTVKAHLSLGAHVGEHCALCERWLPPGAPTVHAAYSDQTFCEVCGAAYTAASAHLDAGVN